VPNQAIVVSYGDMPLRFYTALRVYGARSGAFPPSGACVDWVWIRAGHEPWEKGGRKTRAERWIRDHVRRAEYREVILPFPDRRWEYRPDPDHFLEPRRSDAEVRLLRRIRDCFEHSEAS
jgi:hypothetical protein